MLKGIYLGAYKALHENYNIIYQDINNKRDLGGDMLEIDLTPYDYIIATPPCNYWSIARGNRISDYSLKTKHLLIEIIPKLLKLGKPFIVENVKNIPRMKKYNLFSYPLYVYIIGRHTYWTNIDLGIMIYHIQQRQDFKNHGYVIKYDDMKNKDHQGGFNVHTVIEEFLKEIHKNC